MSLEQQLMSNFEKSVVKLVDRKAELANPVLKGFAPPYRDIKDRTFVFLSKRQSTSKVAVIIMRSDPKEPDVLEFGGRRYGNRKRRTERGPAKGGTDLANVTNGPKGRRRTRRAKPLATFGWWKAGTQATAKAITKGGLS